MKLFTMTALFFGLFSFSSFAGEDNFCDSPQTQAEMTACAYSMASAAKANLDETLKLLLEEAIPDLFVAASDDWQRSMVTEASEIMIQIQNSYLSFGQAKCNADTFDSFGGSIRPMERALCLQNFYEENLQLVNMLYSNL